VSTFVKAASFNSDDHRQLFFLEANGTHIHTGNSSMLSPHAAPETATVTCARPKH
jgi:hypothetical protein